MTTAFQEHVFIDAFRGYSLAKTYQDLSNSLVGKRVHPYLQLLQTKVQWGLTITLIGYSSVTTLDPGLKKCSKASFLYMIDADE